MKLLRILALVAFGVLVVSGADDATASLLVTSLALVPVSPGPVVNAGFGCNFENGKLVCGQGNGGNDANDDQGTHKKKKHKDTDTGSQGERSCPPGYVVLDKPNKCGSFCEPKEGDPCAKAETPATTPAPTEFCCGAKVSAPGDGPNTVRGDNVCLATQAEAEQGLKDDIQKNNWVIVGAINCHPAQ
jgi:hypothetical protein